MKSFNIYSTLKVLPFLVIAFSISGCSTYSPKPYLSKVGNAEVITSTADLSSTLVNKNYVCLQPSADATFSASNSDGINILNFGKNSDGVSDSNNQNGAEMTGRTPAVLLSRELMYRLCEIGNNHSLSKDEMIKLYAKNLELIKAISLSEAKQTTISISSGLTVESSDKSQDQESSTSSATISDESKPNNN